MKINCLNCGHTVTLDDAYGEYDGEVRCFVCGSLLEVRIENDLVKSVRLLTTPQRPHKDTI
jgi:DNA-directed RNA polymerase subunit N (RpoN/RPB10)